MYAEAMEERPSEAGGLIGAREACRRLGVKRTTLYTYVSRGKVRCVNPGGRSRLYSAGDVDRLARMSAARRGHAAVAVGALRWGEPVLDSAITAVEGGLRYRGRPVDELIRGGERFERVAELLWEASPVDPWPAPPRAPRVDAPPIWRMVRALPRLACEDEARHVASPAVEHDRARRLVGALGAAALGRPGGGAAPRDRTMAARLARGLSGDAGRAPLVDAALVASADHELNVSTFAARIAASSGADLYACVGAALYAFTGPRHGAAGDRVEALVEACGRRGVAREIRSRLARGETLPGFGHRLYPDGDPRTPPLLERLRDEAALPEPARTLLAVVERVEGQTGLKATVDLGAVAIALALGAPPGWGAALFGLGRVAGWVAHVLEQRASAELLRPRARYVGP